MGADERRELGGGYRALLAVLPHVTPGCMHFLRVAAGLVCITSLACGGTSPAGGGSSADGGSRDGGPPPGNHKPVAEPGPARSVDVFSEVRLDASGSRDPDGDPIQAYFWVLIVRPAGSGAALRCATSTGPSPS